MRRVIMLEQRCLTCATAAVRKVALRHAHAAVAHPEHYCIALVITATLVLLKHIDVAAIWCLWLDKLLTSVAEG